MPTDSRQFQDLQIRPSRVYDYDYPLGTPPEHLEDDLNEIRTQSALTSIERLAITRDGRIGYTRDGTIAVKRNS